MQGHEGWDDYADYYDWENAQTVGRRDIAFWSDSRMAGRRSDGADPANLGCGTGRVAMPVAKNGATVIGIDRSDSMLARGAHARPPRAAAVARAV